MSHTMRPICAIVVDTCVLCCMMLAWESVGAMRGAEEARMSDTKDQRDALAHPMQPVGIDAHGVARFKRNAIVEYLLDRGPFDMNHLAELPFSAEDRMQFAQLIGYSVCGYGELHYVTDESYDAAAAAVNALRVDGTK